jgi:hypothetical protein
MRDKKNRERPLYFHGYIATVEGESKEALDAKINAVLGDLRAEAYRVMRDENISRMMNGRTSST